METKPRAIIDQRKPPPMNINNVSLFKIFFCFMIFNFLPINKLKKLIKRPIIKNAIAAMSHLWSQRGKLIKLLKTPGVTRPNE